MTLYYLSLCVPLFLIASKLYPIQADIFGKSMILGFFASVEMQLKGFNFKLQLLQGFWEFYNVLLCQLSHEGRWRECTCMYI